MKTAACYIRVSTDDQTEYSPDSQLKLIQDYANKNDIILLNDYIYMEDGGKSGKSMVKRDRFLEMISVAKKKPCPFNIILVWKFSRFARNQEESIVLKSMLSKNGVDVISISEPLPEGPFGNLIERILEWQDEFYLTNLAGEVKRGMREKASRGEPVVPPPIGYSMVDGKYIPNENAALVQNIFSDFLSGLGCRAIAAKYAAIGLKTTRGNTPDNRFIEYILRNPVYVGKIRWSADGRVASRRRYDDPDIMIFDGKHEAIITQDIFDRVQTKFEEQRKRYGKYQRPEQPTEYMLKGLVRCSNCGSTLIQSNQKSPTLQCHRYAKGQCNISHGIVLPKANEAITTYIQDAAMSGTFTVNKKNMSFDAPELNYEKMLDNALSRLERAKQAYQAGVDTLEEYKLNKTQINEKIKQIKSQIKLTDKKVNKSEFRKKLLNVLKIINDPAQNESSKSAALRSVVEKIIFNKAENRFEVFFYE